MEARPEADSDVIDTYRRARSVMPEESTIDLEEHAARIALVVAAAKVASAAKKHNGKVPYVTTQQIRNILDDVEGHLLVEAHSNGNGNGKGAP
jgi:hypothetical protein